MSARHHRSLVVAVGTLLATTPLFALFDGPGWMARCAVAVALTAGTAAGARALRAPLWAQVLAMCAAVLLALTWMFSSGEEILGILPSAATFEHFGMLLGQMPEDVRMHATPVPELDSLLWVAVAGVGLVAILVDLFAVGMRRPALAGLPMLAIYSVPVAVSNDSVPIPLFAIGAIGYLWILGSDNMDRVRRFGRRFTGDGRDVEAWEPSPLAASGRRLAVVGVLVAVVLPLAVPGMTSGLVDRFGPGLGAGSGPGGSGGAGQVNLFAELHGQLNRDETVELVEVTTDDPDPYYLRLATADEISDSGFEPTAPAGRHVSEVQAQQPGTGIPGVTYHEHQAQVEFTDAYAMGLAPTYAELASVDGLSDDWLYDADQQVVFSSRSGQTPSAYEFAYQRPEFRPHALRRARPLPPGHEIQSQFGHAPEVPAVRDVLDSLVDPADAPYDQVRAILGFFSRENDFRYELSTGPATDAPAIADFLDNRSGFCVQYAAAMAWLVRSIDMPARVAFGFTRGRSSGDDTRVLTNRNLHAWTEVYFDGFGWVPFDPTPGTSVTGSSSPGWAPNPQAPIEPEDNGSSPGSGDGNDPSPGASPGSGGPLPEIDEGGGVGGPRPESSSYGLWWALGAVLVTVLLLAQPALHRALLRRRRLRHGAATTVADGDGAVLGDPQAGARHRSHRLWAELQDTMADLQLALDPAETPRGTAQRLAQRLQFDADAPQAVRLLGQAEERARYARTPLADGELRQALRTVRRALLAHAVSQVRTRAVLLPPSTVSRWHTAVGDAGTRVLVALGRVGELLIRLSPRRLLRAAR